MVFIHWLIFTSVAFISFFPFQWLFYTFIRNAHEKVLFGHAFSSSFLYFLACALLINSAMILPNAVSFFVGSLAYHEWFNRAWVLSLTYTAIGISGAAVVLWLKFGELPTKGILVGIALAFAGSLASAFWK